MSGNGCTCGLLPCICVGDVEDAVDFSAEVQSVHISGAAGAPATKAKLRQLFAADATSQCTSCMMLPCICPGDEDPMVGGDDETTSVEAASPLESDQDQVVVDEETDEYGRVRLGSTTTDRLKNEEDDVWIAREIKVLLKPHQVEGVQFLHSHVTAGRGCILADYMGLGKTLQVITVIYSFLVDEIEATKRHSNKNDLQHPHANKRDSQTAADLDTIHEEDNPPATVLVLCPAICLPNWDSEFKKWLSAEARERCPVLTLDSSSTKGTTAGRLRLLQRWKRIGGVLLMGYEMYRGLLNPTTTPVSCATEEDSSIRVCSRMTSATMEITSASAQETAKVQRTAQEFRRLLCAPGADLVVMDEGHRMKDPSSLLCQSVAQIQSPRRLVLTGYPVQNSLSEYWCMVNFAREGFLGSYEEFRAKYERPILEGNAARCQELIERLQSVVLRRGKALLRSQLPPKMEWILYCKLSPVQYQLYCDFLNSYGDSGSPGATTGDLLTAYAALLQVMNHPDIIYSKLCPSQGDGSALLLEDYDESNDDLVALDYSGGWGWESEERLQEKRQIAAAQRRRKRQKLTDTQKSYEWARSVILGGNDIGRVLNASTATAILKPSAQIAANTYHTEVLENSGKMAVLLRIIEESFACGDKVVVFSQSVPTLKVISDFLRASSFSPSRAVDDAAKARKQAGTSSQPKRRRIAPRPNRDPAGILRKRRNQAGVNGPSTRKVAAATAVVSSSEWFLQIDGSTNGAKRVEFIQRFSSTESPVKLLLVSTRAGAEGINLHAANRLVLFDVSWNPSNDHQSMCRSHRIGQVKTVHVYRLVSTGTMERMIYEQQMKKVDLSTSVMDSHEVADQKERATSSVSDTVTLGKEPFSGFLQPPTEADYEKELAVDESMFEGDSVLASCAKTLGRWIVDVHRVHEPLDDEKQSP
ncbi:putative exportin-T [Phytophthora cinnamomi]|uniref:putative exportin-T n=1 Tax=Phytophthora cinnamomi TaxID=4785 RepID=UPI00355937F5|nr:putative exportin-T [Phytophthora cinnamomi]